jgi:two-component system chemotaxis sensor kinase CheA
MAILRNELLPIFRLHRLFGIEGAANDPASALLIVVEWQGKRCALMVDEIIGQQQTVVKSLGSAIPHTRGVSGGAILGDGRVGLILDASDLIAMAQGPLPAVA